MAPNAMVTVLTNITFDILFLEVFTLPHVFRAESELSEDCPRTKFGLNSDFFWLEVHPILKIRVRILS